MLADMPDDVVRELLNPKYESLMHGSKSTYARGCHGPLCRMEERKQAEKTRRKRIESEGREYKPRKRTKGDIHRDELLMQCMAVYMTMRATPANIVENRNRIRAEAS